MTRYSDPALFSEAEVTLVDEKPGHFWDPDSETTRSSGPLTDVLVHDTVDSTIDDALADAGEQPESLPAPPIAAAPAPVLPRRPWPVSFRSARAEAEGRSSGRAASQREWSQDATRARQNLAERRNQREALARVIAIARPRTQATPRTARVRAATQA